MIARFAAVLGRRRTVGLRARRGRRTTGYTRLIMEPAGAHFDSAADFNAPQRQAIEQDGYTIIANLGDQPSDLDGGFAEKTFLLPNPFYRIP